MGNHQRSEENPKEVEGRLEYGGPEQRDSYQVQGRGGVQRRRQTGWGGEMGMFERGRHGEG